MTILGTNNLASINRGVGQTPFTVTVGDVSTEIVGGNIARSSVFLTNIGMNDVWVACDTLAILNRGVLLGKNGGSTLFDSTATTNGPISGICRSGRTSDVTFQELNR